MKTTCRECQAEYDDAEAHICSAVKLEPQKPMTRAQALVYVQHLMIDFLKDEAVGFHFMAQDAEAPAQDRQDAALCESVAKEVAVALTAANAAALAADARVILPGARPPALSILQGGKG